MAEIEMEEVIEGFEEAAEEAEEGAEELSEELREELEAEVAEARAEVSELSKTAEAFKTFAEGASKLAKQFGSFVVKNVAIAVIFWGITTLLNKTIKHQPSEGNKKKKSAIEALYAVIKTESDIIKKVSNWMTEHKDDQINIGGFDVPLESVLSKYTPPLSEAVDAASAIAKTLQSKIDGKVQFNIPTGEDMRKFLEAGDSFLKGFGDLVKFISETEQKVPQLKSFPATQADIDLLTTQLNNAKAMPLW